MIFLPQFARALGLQAYTLSTAKTLDTYEKIFPVLKMKASMINKVLFKLKFIGRDIRMENHCRALSDFRNVSSINEFTGLTPRKFLL